MKEVDDDGNSIESPNDEPAEDEPADDDEPSSRKYISHYILNWPIEEILLNYLWNFR